MRLEPSDAINFLVQNYPELLRAKAIPCMVCGRYPVHLWLTTEDISSEKFKLVIDNIHFRDNNFRQYQYDGYETQPAALPIITAAQIIPRMFWGLEIGHDPYGIWDVPLFHSPLLSLCEEHDAIAESKYTKIPLLIEKS